MVLGAEAKRMWQKKETGASGLSLGRKEWAVMESEGNLECLRN